MSFLYPNKSTWLTRKEVIDFRNLITIRPSGIVSTTKPFKSYQEYILFNWSLCPEVFFCEYLMNWDYIVFELYEDRTMIIDHKIFGLILTERFVSTYLNYLNIFRVKDGKNFPEKTKRRENYNLEISRRKGVLGIFSVMIVKKSVYIQCLNLMNDILMQRMIPNDICSMNYAEFRAKYPNCNTCGYYLSFDGFRCKK